MKIKRKDRKFSSTAVIIFLCVLESQLVFQSCSDENDLLTESPVPTAIVSDSKSYFDSLVVLSMGSQTDLSNTLSPGEITPLWEDAYLETNNNYEYINVPIISQYNFVVRKDLTSKIRHIVAEQILSFRRSKTTGNMSAIYMTFVPTPWYFDRHKGNVAESFCSEENHNNFSGYILYNSPLSFSLHSLVKYKDGKVIDNALRYNSESTDAFKLVLKQKTNNDIFIKKSRFRTKSTDEDDDIIDGGQYTDPVDIIGQYPDIYHPGGGYDHDPWGDDNVDWEEDEDMETLEKIAGYIYF